MAHYTHEDLINMTPTQLKRLRRSIEFTQAEFADLTGYSVESITKMENGRMAIHARAVKIFKQAIDFAKANL